jgi:hypothetical protein
MAQAVAWHRQVAAMVEAADRAGVAPDKLPGLRQRIQTQAGRLTQAATRSGSPLPALIPTPAEIAVAAAAFGDLSAEAVAQAVRTIETTLAAVDATLEGRAAEPGDLSSLAEAAAGASVETPGIPTQPAPEPAPDAPAGTTSAAVGGQARRSVGLRNAAIYGAYAVPVLAVQVFLFVLLDEADGLPAAAPLCLLVLPALAFLAGYLTIGALFPAPPGETVNRTPRLGVVVCLIPNLLLCVGFVTLLVRNFLG